MPEIGETGTIKAVDLEDLTIPPPPISASDWNPDGFVVKKGFVPEDLMVAYEKCWIENNSERLGGWPDCTPYRRHQEVMNILTYQGLHDTMEQLIGEPAGLHLNLTGWASTRRNWHQDTYLNPHHVGDYYVAVWIALETINPDSGPFQFVRGSHRWPVVTQEKILAVLNPDEQDHLLPKHSERILTPLFEAEIEKRNAEVITYLPERGDVLFWHGRLLHRGSEPNVAGILRKSVIAHYSGINHRQDMPSVIKHGDGGWYFPIEDVNVK